MCVYYGVPPFEARSQRYGCTIENSTFGCGKTASARGQSEPFQKTVLLANLWEVFNPPNPAL